MNIKNIDLTSKVELAAEIEKLSELKVKYKAKKYIVSKINARILTYTQCLGDLM